ncbi:hypothetical protein V8C86DRAFT_2461421 [Haematococcus lacustris]
MVGGLWLHHPARGPKPISWKAGSSQAFSSLSHELRRPVCAAHVFLTRDRLLSVLRLILENLATRRRAFDRLRLWWCNFHRLGLGCAGISSPPDVTGTRQHDVEQRRVCGLPLMEQDAARRCCDQDCCSCQIVQHRCRKAYEWPQTREECRQHRHVCLAALSCWQQLHETPAACGCEPLLGHGPCALTELVSHVSCLVGLRARRPHRDLGSAARGVSHPGPARVAHPRLPLTLPHIAWWHQGRKVSCQPAHCLPSQAIPGLT